MVYCDTFKFSWLILLTLVSVFKGSHSLFLDTFFRAWGRQATPVTCKASCQLSLTCWFAGGRVNSLSDCKGFFEVCCEHDKVAVAEARKMDNWDVAITNVIDDPQDVHYGPVTNEIICGKPTIARRRIVGGTEAGFGAFPWQAMIRVGSTRCGGALIGRQHVVTAGHCVHSLAKKYEEYPPSGIKVYLGEYSLYGDIEPLPRQIFSVSRIYMHPYYEFSPQADRYDVAVIKLSRLVIFEPHILPICLPEKNQEFSTDSVAMVTGWGATEADSIKRPRELQVADVNVVSSEVCEKWHQGNNIKIEIFDDMMCAGHEEGGKDACQGDSGGPLMIRDTNSDKWTLLGVVSAGFSCAKPGQPGIYHRVTKTSDWISYIKNQT